MNKRFVYFIESMKHFIHHSMRFQEKPLNNYLTRLADDYRKLTYVTRKGLLLDLNKSFDRLDYHILLIKLQKLNFTGNIQLLVSYKPSANAL